MALAVAVLLLVSRFDVVIRSSEDLVARGDSSILGSVPVAADADIELLPSRGMAFLQSSFWESFRSIRTNLTFVRVDSPPKRLVVTSAVENEGKTTTAIALATVLAEGGHSVLLVDADLRRPSVSTRLGLTSDVGLTDCLSGSVPLDSAVQSSTLPGLSIVSSGRTPPNPAELLASDRAAAVFSDFGSRFDFVIVDSPPVLRVTDAVVMARSVGCVLMVARAGVSRLPEYSRAVSELNLVGGDIIGAILNGCDRASSRYSYGYGVTHS
ncbi:CpsD/CapB family tyrosine-protein kinase [Gordonia polyisoprenivorans]|uniref:CpsD/CapB family tyrosine-protein kinase n=1 Tax=Gordonia polyisoprenivorans TaxID=84595 RepID=UPI001E432385|nr:CpsD/CapB family tyrosine-protein kinase [Gordonia polyisoprenivorans]